jgi:signal transduction histidine kinase
MNHRVTELVEMAKNQIGDVKVQMTPLEIKSVLIDSVSQLMVLFDSRHQKLNFDIPDNLPPVEADKDKIQQIVFNLLANANKYSPENSSITLAAKQVGNHVHFEVRDSAPVITDENREKIFAPYYRIENSALNTSTAGLGLGLSISKKLVELHKGKIWVETNPQGGNVFIFSLPV